MKMKTICCVLFLAVFILGVGVSDALSETKTSVSVFNGNVCVKIRGQEETVELGPGKALMTREMMGKIVSEKGAIMWKDIAQYEAGMVARDPGTKYLIDTMWTDRINRLLDIVQKKYKQVPPIGDLLVALGIPKQRPTYGVYCYIPDVSGGKAGKVGVGRVGVARPDPDYTRNYIDSFLQDAPTVQSAQESLGQSTPIS